MSVTTRTRTCRAEGCGSPTNLEGGYCAPCSRPVYAFCPRPSYAPDEWFLAGHDGELEAIRQDGDHFISADQCDGCGLATYGVYTHPSGGWYARCDGQEMDGEWYRGCGAEYRIERKPSWQVIF
jgi:hypothetical protein